MEKYVREIRIEDTCVRVPVSHVSGMEVLVI